MFFFMTFHLLPFKRPVHPLFLQHKSRLEYPAYVYLKVENTELLNTLACFTVNSEIKL